MSVPVLRQGMCAAPKEAALFPPAGGAWALALRRMPRTKSLPKSPARAPAPRRPPARKRPPQSQSLSQSYGSNLPTSLAYIALKTRGSSPWRPDAVIGTARCKSPLSPLRGREGSQTFHGTSPEPQSRAQTRTACTQRAQAPSPAKPIPALGRARVEETSLPGSAAIVVGAPVRRYYTRVAASLAPAPQHVAGARKHGQEQVPASLLASPGLPKGTHPLLSRTLGPPHPRRNALPVEPFSTSAYKVPACILATHTKICTRPRSTPAHAGASPQGPRLLTHTRARAWWRISLPLERHPFSGLLHSAGMLLHTSERVPTSMGTVLLSS